MSCCYNNIFGEICSAGDVTAADQFFAKTGTDTSPGYSFIDEKTLGIERTGPGAIAVASGGTEIFTISPTEVSTTADIVYGEFGQLVDFNNVTGGAAYGPTSFTGIPRLLNYLSLGSGPVQTSIATTANTLYSFATGGTPLVTDPTGVLVYNTTGVVGSIETSTPGIYRITGIINWSYGTSTIGGANCTIYVQLGSETAVTYPIATTTNYTGQTQYTDFSTFVYKQGNSSDSIQMKFSTSNSTSSSTLSVNYQKLYYEYCPGGPTS
jgi:hypothetical protein